MGTIRRLVCILFIFERDVLTVRLRVQRVQRILIGVDELFGDRVFEILLDRAAQIARAILHGIGFLDQIVHEAPVPIERQPARVQAVAQLAEHDARDGTEILFRQLVEADDFVHAVDELGPQELAEGLERLFLALLRDGLAEADAAILPVRTGIGRHNDDGILEIDHAPLCVGDAPVIEDLQQDVQHVGMRLFQLVKEDDRIRAAAGPCSMRSIRPMLLAAISALH